MDELMVGLALVALVLREMYWSRRCAALESVIASAKRESDDVEAALDGQPVRRKYEHG